MLLDSGAHTNLQDKSGKTALDVKAEKDKEKRVLLRIKEEEARRCPDLAKLEAGLLAEKDSLNHRH